MPLRAEVAAAADAAASERLFCTIPVAALSTAADAVLASAFTAALNAAPPSETPLDWSSMLPLLVVLSLVSGAPLDASIAAAAPLLLTAASSSSSAAKRATR